MGGMREGVGQSDRGGLSRRQMIKASAVAGAAAWTAPMIIDSLASPAAAGTCPDGSGIYTLQVNPPSTGCPTTTNTVGNAQCAPPCPGTKVPAGTALSTYCITSPNCSALATSVTFTIGSGAGCTCVFTGIAGGTADSFSDLEQHSDFQGQNCDDGCLRGTLSANKKAVTWARSGNACTYLNDPNKPWGPFVLRIQCT